MSQDHGLLDLRLSLRVRLEFIEFRLYWEGSVNRSDLIGQFEISEPQATLDFRRYQELAPGNMTYERGARSYKPTDAFQPLLYKPDPYEYLKLLREKPKGSWSSLDVLAESVPVPSRRLAPEVVREIAMALHRAIPIRINYLSVSHLEPEFSWRTVTPSALGFDGYRWHLRAFCHRDKKYKDYAVARIRAVAPDSSRVEVPLDKQWENRINFILAPAPGLNPATRATFEFDYAMEDGKREFPVRECFAFYVERQLCLDEVFDQAPPERKQLVLVNRQEIHEVLYSHA